MSTKANVRLISFCFFLIFAMLTLSATLIYSAGFQDLESYMTIRFESEPISLNFSNNAGSNVNASTCYVVFNADESKFKIVGPVPTTQNDAVTNISDLTNTSGAEFYYFCTNADVANSANYVDPGQIYYTSTVDSTLESWYDTPKTHTNVYSCFMVSNCTDGNLTNYTASSSALIVSNSVVSLAKQSWQDKDNTTTNAVLPQSVTKITGYSYTTYGAFYCCYKLQKITIPSSVSEIGSQAFVSCYNLDKIIIESGVSGISAQAFCTGSDLKELLVSSENVNYKVVNNCLIDKSSNEIMQFWARSQIPMDGSVTTIADKFWATSSMIFKSYYPLYIPASIEFVSSMPGFDGTHALKIYTNGTSKSDSSWWTGNFYDYDEEVNAVFGTSFEDYLKIVDSLEKIE